MVSKMLKNVRSCKYFSYLQLCTYRYIFFFIQAYSIFNQDDIEDFRVVFNYFTTSNAADGDETTVSAKQVRTALRSLTPKPKDEDINEIYDDVTKNKGGRVDFPGFLTALHTAIQKVRKQQIQDNKNSKKDQVKVYKIF